MWKLKTSTSPPLGFPKSRCAVYLGLFQPQCRIEVEQRSAERRFQTCHEIPFRPVPAPSSRWGGKEARRKTWGGKSRC
ncbi:MAG: hypothetical protein ACLR6J_04850 [Parabacteroides merdae]